MSGSSEPRVMALAVAEATLDLIRPWAAAGELPTFRRFLEEGSFGTVRADVPPVTQALWPTIVTGRRPGHHGVFDFWQRGADGRFFETNGSKIACKTLWQRLDEDGLASGIVNVPCSWPPHPIRGFMISGQDAPGARRDIAHPPELFDELEAKFGAYRLKDIFPMGRQKDDYLTLFQDQIARQADVLEHLARRKDWSFFLAFIGATALAQHFFWADMESGDRENPYRDLVLTAYRCVDTAIARLLEAAGPDTTTFVVSECGAGPLRSGVNLNAWLEREGFLRRTSVAGSDGNAMSRRLRTLARNSLTQVRMRIKRHLPRPLYYWVNANFPGVKTRVQSYLLAGGIDWSRTVAFARGKEGAIFINREGRDPHGIVKPGAEYEGVRKAIAERLEALVDPATGDTAVARVHRSEDLYAGPMIEYAPDLAIEWRDTAYLPNEQEEETGEIFVTRMREDTRFPTTGSHRSDGVLLAMGPGIEAGERATQASIVDLVPTWLRALGRPVPAELEGHALTELFTRSAPEAGAGAAKASPGVDG